VTTTLCFIDTETTGLDPRIHQPYEVSMWREDLDEPETLWLPHTLEHADPQALAIGRYWERSSGYSRISSVASQRVTASLRGATLVGSNPAFDAAMMTRFVGTPIWHHRLINVAEGGMWVFGWDRPKGLADVTAALRERGYEIPEPDHTAEGDVRATRAVYEALRQERAA
jgi:hypothetical protein